MDFNRISFAQLIVSVQAFVFSFSFELAMASRYVFISSIWTPVKPLTILASAPPVCVTDVQRMANLSVTLFKIDARNLAVSQLAMSAAGEVWSLEP